MKRSRDEIDIMNNIGDMWKYELALRQIHNAIVSKHSLSCK